MIKVLNTTIGYRAALFHIHELELETGMIYTLIGPNGKGKTTFLKTLNGQLAPLSGSLSINGKAVEAYSNDQLARIQAFVNPRFEGVDHLSVFDYVMLGRTPYLPFNGKPRPQDIKFVQELLTSTGITHLQDKSTSKISDGERQLASVCRALAQETPLILLDEPTAFLDYPNKLKIIRLLKKVAKEQHKCILLSSHDLELCIQEDLALLAITKRNELENFTGVKKEFLLGSCFEQIEQH